MLFVSDNDFLQNNKIIFVTYLNKKEQISPGLKG